MLFRSFSAAASAGTNRAASSSTSLNTRKLDEETENLTREYICVSVSKTLEKRTIH